MKLDFDANTVEGATEYLETRAKQFLKHGFELQLIKEMREGVVCAFFKKVGAPYTAPLYQSIYILKDFRGKGLYQKSLLGYPILTADDCNITEYLIANDIEFVSLNVEREENNET